MQKTTTEELERQLPPEVSEVIGCTAFNQRRAEVWAAVECAHRHGNAKLERLRPDDPARASVEAGIVAAVTTFEAACKRLETQRRALLCEPGGRAVSPDAALQSLKVPLIPTNVQRATMEVSAFNRRAEAHNAAVRRGTAAAANTWNAACTAWLSAPWKDGTAPDNVLRGRNVAGAKLTDACRPFAGEAQRLAAMRAALVKVQKNEVTK